jgi:hypothetical protein
LVLGDDISQSAAEGLLETIADWDEVEAVERLKPDSVQPTLRRLCHVTVTEDADPVAVAARLADLPEVESAEPSSVRRLI